MKLKPNKIYKYKHITETGVEVQKMFQVLEEQEDHYIIDCGNGTGRTELLKSEVENLNIQPMG